MCMFVHVCVCLCVCVLPVVISLHASKDSYSSKLLIYLKHHDIIL